MSVRALDAGPGALRALHGTGPGAVHPLRPHGDGRVELVLDGGGYVSLGRDRWLLVAGPRAPRGPLTLRVAALPPLVAGTPAGVVDGRLEVGREAIVVAGMRVAPSAPFPLAPPLLRPPLTSLPPLPPAPPELGAGLEALTVGRLRDAVALLAGRGDGLTPAGDDVLAGYAGWRAWTGAPVALAEAAAPRTTPLSAAYLGCAERGELPEAVEALIVALHAGDAAASARAAARLGRWGATSGGALMLGMAAAGAAARTARHRPARPPESAPPVPTAPR